MEKDIFKMELHETLSINGTFTIMRVPGGWIYYSHNMLIDSPEHGVFVPEISKYTKEEKHV